MRRNPHHGSDVRAWFSRQLVHEDEDEGYDLPDPPENLDFAELPEAFQERVAERMLNGIRLTRYENEQARERHANQVALMLGKRARANRAEAERRARRNAGRATLAEYGLTRGAK